jgi:hypothetical protein
MMSRTISVLAALSLLFSAFDASAAGGPPYKLDAKGNCHDSSGKFAKKSLCTGSAPSTAATPTTATASSAKVATPKTASQKCKDPKTKKFVKCTAAGAVPA